MKREEIKKTCTAVVAALAAILLPLPDCLGYFGIDLKSGPLAWKIAYCAGLAICLIVTAAIAFYNLFNFREIRRLEDAERMSNSTFLALQDANRNKTREVMRYTYGQVSRWDKINYFQNLLMYDSHEQIRYILMSLRDLIISYDEKERFNKDNVTVDLVYCYGDIKSYKKISPDDIKDSFRLISSGDNDCGSIVKDLLLDLLSDQGDNQSFYSLLLSCEQDANNGGNVNSASSTQGVNAGVKTLPQHNYANAFSQCEGFLFLNDKYRHISKANHQKYISSTKDNLYANIDAGGLRKNDDNAVGSIVGLILYLKNDEPQQVGITAILTITTYGSRLIDGKAKQKDLKGFTQDFYKKVLCSYKSLLISELAQMYIRHQIKQGIRNPITGESFSEYKTEDENIKKELKKIKDKAKDKYHETMNDVEKQVNTAFENSKKEYDNVMNSCSQSLTKANPQNNAFKQSLPKCYRFLRNRKKMVKPIRR